MLLVSLSLATPQKRLNKEQFLKLARQAQHRYLETYPKSKHRFLVQERVRKAKKAARPAKLPKAEPTKVRRLSRAEYSALDDKGKNRYNERFPKSSHTPRFRKARKPFTKTKHDNKESRTETGRRRKDESLKVDKQRMTMHDEGAGTINKQSVMALSQIRPEQLRQGAANINSNREEIHGLIDQEMQARPNLYGRGLASVRDMMHGGLLDDDVEDAEFEEVDEAQAEDDDGNPLNDEDGKPITKKQKKERDAELGPDPSLEDEDEDDDEDRKKKKKKKKGKKDKKKQRDGQAVLTSIAKFALLGAGVALLAVGAGPLGMVIGRGLMDLWTSIESNAAANPQKTQEEIDHDTVDEILTHTVSYMRNMQLEDMRQSSEHLFEAIAADQLDIYNECFSACLPLVQGRPKGRPGKNFFGGANVDVHTLAAAMRTRLNKLGVLYSEEHEYGPHDEAYMFFCKDKDRTLVAMGMTNASSLYHVAMLNW
jgi:hypothetical protein